MSERSKAGHKSVLWLAFLGFVRHKDNVLFIIPMVGIFSWLVYTGLELRDCLLFLLGWLIFLPQEYFTHVFVLHIGAPKNAVLYRWAYRMHYGHHDLPKRDDLMYIPLWLTVPMTLLNLLVLYYIMPDERSMLAAFSGELFGYLLFEWSHLFCHLPYIPKTKIGKLIKKQHLWHHFHNEKYWYSVSAPALFLDNIFRTQSNIRSVDRSNTSDYLGVSSNDTRLISARDYFACRSSGDLENSRLWLDRAKAEVESTSIPVSSAGLVKTRQLSNDV